MLCGATSNSKTLIIGRAIAGLGGAGLSVGGSSIVAFTVRPTKRPMMMVVIGMTYCLAAVLGLLLGLSSVATVTAPFTDILNSASTNGSASTSTSRSEASRPWSSCKSSTCQLLVHPSQVLWWKKLLHVDSIGVFLAKEGITCLGFILLVPALVGRKIWQGMYSS